MVLKAVHAMLEMSLITAQLYSHIPYNFENSIVKRANIRLLVFLLTLHIESLSFINRCN